jgi:hypothetical protein
MLDDAAPDVQWEIVADNLNIHLSESVVRIVARRCGVTQDLEHYPTKLDRQNRDSQRETDERVCFQA